jgi:hypothetical protein
VSNTANIQCDASDPNPDNNAKIAFLTILPGTAPDADLDATKFVDDDGSGGPNDATNVKIRDNFPADTTYVSDNSGGVRHRNGHSSGPGRPRG